MDYNSSPLPSLRAQRSNPEWVRNPGLLPRFAHRNDGVFIDWPPVKRLHLQATRRALLEKTAAG
jgi:hypothetical protein